MHYMIKLYLYYVLIMVSSFYYISDSLLNNLSGRLQVLDEGDLLITGTTAADSGKYTCVRHNDAGNVSGEAYVTVLGMIIK